jgi:hypothetical protein
VADAFEITRSLPHGHVAAVHAMARQLGFPALLGPACRQRDLALALIVSRVVRPKPKLSTLSWWGDVTLGQDLGVADASPAEVYAAMDWLRGRQDAIEAQLAGRHLSEGGMAMFDLSSSWMEGTHCELAARGYSRDGKKGKTQIEYGLLTDAQARPVAIRVFAGNTADPTAFIEAVTVVLAQYLTWHLRRTLAPLTYTDETPPARDTPVTAAKRSTAATSKARNKTDPDHNPVRSFRDLLHHLGTLTRNTTIFTGRTIDVLATPTPTQRRAFELIGAPIPLTLT